MKKCTAREILNSLVRLHPGIITDTDVDCPGLVGDLTQLLEDYYYRQHLVELAGDYDD